MLRLFGVLLRSAVAALRTRRQLNLENLALRQQLSVLLARRRGVSEPLKKGALRRDERLRTGPRVASRATLRLSPPDVVARLAVQAGVPADIRRVVGAPRVQVLDPARIAAQERLSKSSSWLPAGGPLFLVVQKHDGGARAVLALALEVGFPTTGSATPWSPR